MWLRLTGIRRLLIGIVVIALWQGVNPASARPDAAQVGGKPFTLPFSTPPGPSTWLAGQGFGSTREAYNYGKYWYAAGQGLHFGIDLSAPCQTPVVAVADGVVDQIDNFSFGSLPHNLTIVHRELGYISFYGHLYAKPTVSRGQPVRRGDVVALSGDPDRTCVSRPHLHLEIRSIGRAVAFNPVELIDADWAMLSTIGGLGRFEKDLYHPNRWQTPGDQPEVQFGKNFINIFQAAWPPPARIQPPPLTLPAVSAPPIPNPAQPAFSRLTPPDCCSMAWWSPDSRSIRFWNGPDGQLAQVQALNIADGKISYPENATPLSLSPDGSYSLQWTPERTIITRSSDGAQFSLATSSTWPRFSPGSKRLLWQRFPGDVVPGNLPPQTEVWIANVDGSGRTLIGTQPGGSVQWLDDDRILLTRREGQTDMFTLSIYTISSHVTQPLLTAKNLRGVSVAPGGQYIMYYLSFQNNPEDSAMYLLEMKATARPVKLPFFGSWRWRDSRSVVYIPYAPFAPMSFVLYDVVSGQERLLTDPARQKFSILNDDWSISPDGSRILFWEARDRALYTVLLPATAI